MSRRHNPIPRILLLAAAALALAGCVVEPCCYRPAYVEGPPVIVHGGGWHEGWHRW